MGAYNFGLKKMNTLKFVLLGTIISALKPNTTAQELTIEEVNYYEHQLDDVMEIIDLERLKQKLKEVEFEFAQDSVNFINHVRLGIVYHEVALNLSFFSDQGGEGYANKSYTLFAELRKKSDLDEALKPFVISYQASALALVSAKSKSLKVLTQAYDLFEYSIKNYAEVSYLPYFLRGSVTENLPWYFLRKKKVSKNDFDLIISQYQVDNNYASPKIMSFTYWAWANQHPQKKYRKIATHYLNLAIELDPEYNGGRQRAEELITKWEQ